MKCNFKKLNINRLPVKRLTFNILYNQASIISIVTTLQGDFQRMVQFLAGVRYLSILKSIQTGYGANEASYSMKMITHVHL
jgi:hypothetical protein